MATKTLPNPPKPVLGAPEAPAAPAKKAAKSRERGYSPAERAEHCEALFVWLEDGKTLRSFCRQPGRPSYGAFYDWIEADEALASRVARARDIGYDSLAEEAKEISDTPLPGKRIKQTEDGTEVTIEDMLGHRKLQIETRLKLLACWNPKKYGQRQLVGSDPENPIVPPQVGDVFNEILKGIALQRAAAAKKE
jgi:hypothetical protein